MATWFDRSDYDVFEEATPAAKQLIDHVIQSFEQAKNSADNLRQAIERLKSEKVAETRSRRGQSILYPPGHGDLLDDIDAILLNLKPWDELPTNQIICDQLRGMKGLGMAPSTLRDMLIQRGELRDGMTVRAWLRQRKELVDARRESSSAKRYIPHVVAAGVIAMSTCMSRLDPGHVRGLLMT